MSDRFSISLPGNDVFKAKPGDLVLDSQYPSPKVNTLAQPLHAGLLTINWLSSNVVVPKGQTKLLYSFTHGYDYVPTAFAAYTFTDGSFVSSGILPFQYGAQGIIVIDTDPTSLNIKYFSFDFTNTSIPPFQLKVRYYVFAERGF